MRINLRKGLITLTAMAVSMTVFSQDLSHFKKRFKFVRDDAGKLSTVKDTSITMKFSIRPYLEFIKESLQQEQALMKSKADYDQRIEDLFGANQEQFLMHDKSSRSRRDSRNRRRRGNAQGDNSNPSLIVESLRKLEDIDFDKVFADPKFQEVMTKFEFKLRDALMMLDPTVLAHASNPRFFYQKRVTYQVLTWALNFAKDRLSQIPILNTASYVLVRVEELVRQRRLFHQNMLLHYIEKVPESQLGITAEEANHIMSSIYESRIDWFAFWESNAAVANWDKYGVNKFFTSIRFNNNRFRRMSTTFDEVGKRLNYAFQEVDFKGEAVIANLFQTDHMFSKNLSVSYNYDNPGKVMRKRLVVQLAELGLSFVSLPSFIKGIATDWMQSFYKEQALTEGALYGHFEMYNQKDELQMLRLQILNPFETL